VVSLGGDEGSRAAPTLPGKVQPGAVQAYTTPLAVGADDPVAVASINDAVKLFSDVTTLLTTKTGTSSLFAADTSAYDPRFNILFPNNTIEDSLILPLISFVVPIDNSLVLTTNPHGSVDTGRISGSSTSTYSIYSANESFNKIGDFFSEYSDNTFTTTTPRNAKFKVKGDTFTEDYKGNRTFAITKGFVHTTTNQNLKVAGNIYVEYSSTDKRTVTHVQDQIYSKSSKSQTKFAVTLVASDGNKGAKFVLRGASASNSASTWLNTVNTSGDTVFSNLEVYDNDGNEILSFEVDPVDPPSIPIDHKTAQNPTTLKNAADAWFTFAKDVIARDKAKAITLK
jgi:hypothetical protein